MGRLSKIVLVLALLAGLAYLFVRSLQSTRAEPYTVRAEHLRGWTLALDEAPGDSGAALSLRPPQPLAPALFQQIFSRVMESLAAPPRPGLALVLQGEFERSFAGRVAPEALVAAAEAAGLAAAAPEPVCLAHRRVSAPGVSRQLYFVVFRSPAFAAFRQRAAARLDQGGAGRHGFEPSALSPVLIVAASDGAFARWQPVQPDEARDCVAPIAVVPGTVKALNSAWHLPQM